MIKHTGNFEDCTHCRKYVRTYIELGQRGIIGTMKRLHRVAIKRQLEKRAQEGIING